MINLRVLNIKIFNYYINQIGADFFPIKVKVLCDKFVGMDQNFIVPNKFEEKINVDSIAFPYTNTNTKINNNVLENFDDEIERLIKAELSNDRANTCPIEEDDIYNEIVTQMINEPEMEFKKATGTTGTPKKMTRKERKLKKDEKNCKDIKTMIEHMKNNATLPTFTSSLKNKNESSFTQLQNTVSTNFTNDKTLIKDLNINRIRESENKLVVNRKLQFLKEQENIKKEGNETAKSDEQKNDYKFVLDLNDLF